MRWKELSVDVGLHLEALQLGDNHKTVRDENFR
jgi:hypothetical protein